MSSWDCVLKSLQQPPGSVLCVCHRAVSQCCVSFHSDGAGGSDEGQTAGNTNAPVPGSSTKSSQNSEESDHELDEYDLDKYDEEEYTGKKNLCVRYAVQVKNFSTS